MDQVAFAAACVAARENRGVGTLGEKALHAVLKRYYSADGADHELPVGRFVADAVNDEGLVEIQSRQWYRLVPKLEVYLSVSPVTVVYPLVRRRCVVWTAPESGEILSQKKSPKIGKIWDLFPELYTVRQFLLHPGLTVRVATVDADDYRVADGFGPQKHKRATKLELMPTALVDEYVFRTPEDYGDLLPADLPARFTAAAFAKDLKIPLGVAQKTVAVLKYLGVLEVCGKDGRAYVYERKL